MRKYVFAVALLTCAAASPAMAQDTETYETGRFHVTGIIGYDSAGDDLADASGVVYGIGAGYDFNVGRNLVIGPEAELTSSSSDACETGVLAGGDIACIDAGRDIYVGGRVGVRFRGIGGTRNSLAYVGAGYTNAEFGVSYDGPGTANDFAFTDQLDGYRLKAGVELGIGGNAFVRTEYRYSNYEGDFDRHQVIGGFGFRF